MARLKTNSRNIQKAHKRIVGLKTIDEELNFGNGLDLRSYHESIETAQRSLEAYNAALVAVDAARNILLEADKKLAYLNEHMLLAVATRYGKDSIQYKQGGGVPKSERKRPTPKAKAISG